MAFAAALACFTRSFASGMPHPSAGSLCTRRTYVGKDVDGHLVYVNLFELKHG